MATDIGGQCARRVNLDGVLYQYVAYQGSAALWPVNRDMTRGWGLQAMWRLRFVWSTDYSHDIARVPSTRWPHADGCEDGQSPVSPCALSLIAGLARRTVIWPGRRRIIFDRADSTDWS